MLRLLYTPHDRRAKDGSLSAADGLAAVGQLVGRRAPRPKPLAIVADSDGHRLRRGRRTVTSWLRALASASASRTIITFSSRWDARPKTWPSDCSVCC